MSLSYLWNLVVCIFLIVGFSKEEIYTSKVKYFVKKGRPYIWVPEKDLHNVVGSFFLWFFHVLPEQKSRFVFQFVAD